MHVSRHNKISLLVLCNFPDTAEERDILKKTKKSCLGIKLLTGERKREDQGKRVICTTTERSKIFYSFLLLNMQGGFRKYCDHFYVMSLYLCLPVSKENNQEPLWSLGGASSIHGMYSNIFFFNISSPALVNIL